MLVSSSAAPAVGSTGTGEERVPDGPAPLGSTDSATTSASSSVTSRSSASCSAGTSSSSSPSPR